MTNVKAKTVKGASALANLKLSSAVVVLAAMLLSGCMTPQNSTDLERYVEQVLSRSSTKIEPLPPIPPYAVYAYASGQADEKDPFQTFFEKPDEESVQVEQCTPGVDPNCIAPDPDRRREELEFYPLDSLRMVGTLEQEGEIWGVVMSSDANLYRVTIDNYMGQNHGRVINIQEEGIELLEIVPNGTGGWRERSTKVALAE